jgi:ribonuclease HI
LSRIADEKAAAKAETDGIIEGLEAAKNELRIAVKLATDSNVELNQQYETLLYEASRETDSKQKALKEAQAAQITGQI